MANGRPMAEISGDDGDEIFSAPPEFLDCQVHRFVSAEYAMPYYQTEESGMLPITAQTLRQRLREHGLLASIDAGRQMLLVRRTLEGTPKQVLHLRASDFVNPTGAAV